MGLLTLGGPRPGQRFYVGEEPYPGYELIRRLGTGGFGEVWEAEVGKSRHCALKFMPCAGPQAATKEIRALQMVGRLTHPNLMPIERVWPYRNSLVIEMDLADGSLHDLYQIQREENDQPLPKDMVCMYLEQMARVLDFLNVRRHRLDGMSVGIQHCDVKPSNMLLFGERIKISDFGLVTMLTAWGKERSPAGTPDYAAPEVFRGQVTEKTDQYSLALCYCMLRGGRLPFADTPDTLNPDYVRPAPDLSMLPPLERPIIAAALAPLPRCRWGSCLEMMEELKRAQS